MRKRSNWNTTLPTPVIPVGPTSFELTVQELGLTPTQYKQSRELKSWVSKNKNSKYVPPDLLKAWGLAVNEEG